MTRRVMALIAAGGFGAAALATALALVLSPGSHYGGAPVNDKMADAAPVRDGLISGSTAYAVPDLRAVAAGVERAGSAAVWFKWKAPYSGVAALASATAVRPRVAVFAGVPSRQRAVAVQGRRAGGLEEFRAAAGQTYYFAVGQTPGRGPFRFVLLAPTPQLVSLPERQGVRPEQVPGTAGKSHRAPETARPAQSAADATTTLAQSTTTGSGGPGPKVSCAPAPTGWTRGPVSIACTASSPGGLLRPSDASFTLVASVPDGEVLGDAATSSHVVCDVDGNCTTAGPVTGLKIARVGPDVACSPPSQGWSATNIVVTCLSTPRGPGLADPTQASMSRGTTVPAGAAAVVTLPAVRVCDAIGNCTTAGPFGPLEVDRTVPVAKCGAAPKTWSGRNIEIQCHVSDAASGLSDPSQASVVLSTSVPDGGISTNASTSSTKVCSVVGNCVTVGPVRNLEIDRSVPRVACTVPAGWSAGPVAVECEAAEAGAGLAVPAQARFTLEASVKPGARTSDAATGTETVCSAVGNCATAGPVTQIKIDAAPPLITCAPAPAGWADADVKIRCNASDDASGLRVPAQAAFDLVATVPAGGWSRDASTGTKRICSRVGLCAMAGPVTGIKIDTTRPTVSCSAPPKGTVTMNILVSCAASDGASGLADPADSMFQLATSVSAGSRDKKASTGSRTVCSMAGVCRQAGPFWADIDRTSAPSGGWPTVAVPAMATVVLGSTTPPEGSARAYPYPSAHDSLGELLHPVCSPGPSAPLQPGWNVISCDATDGAGRQTVASFPLVVKVDPTVAPRGPAVAGAIWRAVGLGYEPGSPVMVTFDAELMAVGKARPDGSAALTFDLPAGAGIGEHEVALSGMDPKGDPLTVLVPLRSTVVGRVGQRGLADLGPRSRVMPKGAPFVPAPGASLPASPGGQPLVPAAVHVTVPGAAVAGGKTEAGGQGNVVPTSTTDRSGPTTATTIPRARTHRPGPITRTTTAFSRTTTTPPAQSATTTAGSTTTGPVSAPGPRRIASGAGANGALGARGGGLTWWIWLLIAVGIVSGLGLSARLSRRSRRRT